MSSEFERIAFIRRLSRPPHPGLIQDIGDDCAVFNPEGMGRLLVTTDLLVEGVHFTRSWISPRLLGRKACVVNVSDLAAMGARPFACQLALAVPAGYPDTDFERLITGFVESSSGYGMALVGGDLSSSSVLTISVTAMGCLEQGEPVLRSGARPGDQLFVAGRLGYSRCGFEYLSSQPGAGFAGAEDVEGLRGLTGGGSTLEWVAAHLLPEALVEPGQFLQKKGLATSMIDVSDGFASDLLHILEESRVAAEVDAGLLPSLPGLEPESSVDRVLNGGEDYALAFTVDSSRCAELERLWRPDWPPLCRVGSIREGAPVISLRREGRLDIIQPKGFDHFK